MTHYNRKARELLEQALEGMNNINLTEACERMELEAINRGKRITIYERRRVAGLMHQSGWECYRKKKVREGWNSWWKRATT